MLKCVQSLMIISELTAGAFKSLYFRVATQTLSYKVFVPNCTTYGMDITSKNFTSPTTLLQFKIDDLGWGDRGQEKWQP